MKYNLKIIKVTDLKLFSCVCEYTSYLYGQEYLQTHHIFHRQILKAEFTIYILIIEL